MASSRFSSKDIVCSDLVLSLTFELYRFDSGFSWFTKRWGAGWGATADGTKTLHRSVIWKSSEGLGSVLTGRPRSVRDTLSSFNSSSSLAVGTL